MVHISNDTFGDLSSDRGDQGHPPG
jgi:hypothetical protein